MQPFPVFLAVDPVILTIRDGKLLALLKKRLHEPDTGKFELLGALVGPHETADEAATRAVHAVLGDETVYLAQFHTFTNPERDPRSRTISVGYVALVAPTLHVPHDAHWRAVHDLPELAFDHAHIITSAVTYLREHIDEVIVQQFLPKRFPLNTLQAAYEAIGGAPLDNRNFRKRMLALNLVKETDACEQGVSHRPAKLYEFTVPQATAAP